MFIYGSVRLQCAWRSTPDETTAFSHGIKPWWSWKLKFSNQLTKKQRCSPLGSSHVGTEVSEKKGMGWKVNQGSSNVLVACQHQSSKWWIPRGSGQCCEVEVPVPYNGTRYVTRVPGEKWEIRGGSNNMHAASYFQMSWT